MTSQSERAADLLRRADVALEELATAPGGEHEIYASHDMELRAVYEHDDFSVSASDESSQFGIRTIDGGRLGFVTTNARGEEALRAAAREARDVARVSSPSEFHHVAEGPSAIEHDEVCDPALLTLAPKDLYAYLERVVAEARGDPRVTLDRAEVTWTVSTEVIASSSGVRGSAAHASCRWMAMGMAKAGDEVTSFDYDGSCAMARDAIEAEIVRTMGTFRESVIGSLGARACDSYRGAVLLHPNVVDELLGYLVQANCSGRMHVDGMSPWMGRVGEQVASELLTIYEDPHDRTMSDWAPFDREGVRTARHALIENGRLAFVGYDGFSARRAGQTPTGNAGGGPGSLPYVDFSNVTVVADPAKGRVLSEADLARELGTGLVVKRFSGNMDPQDGQFSGIAKNSWCVQGGERAHPVNEVMIAGNAFEVLNRIVAAGDTLHDLMGSDRAPYLLVDGVSVTGG